jgi:hypothetical protein
LEPLFEGVEKTPFDAPKFEKPARSLWVMASAQTLFQGWIFMIRVNKFAEKFAEINCN